jgi:alpha-glucosidase
MWRQTQDGTPLLLPLFYLYPEDPKTYGIELQYFYGPGLLISPVTQEDSTSVSAYFPKGVYYDYFTHEVVEGKGEYITINNVDITSIPLHYRGGVVFPQRVESAMTTTALRKNDFELIVAIDEHGRADGELYLDDGISLVQKTITHKIFSFSRGVFSVSGKHDLDDGLRIKRIVFLGMGKSPQTARMNGVQHAVTHDAGVGKVVAHGNWSMSEDFQISFHDEEVDQRPFVIQPGKSKMRKVCI